MKRADSITRNWFKLWSNEYDRTLGSISFHRELLDLATDMSGVKPGDEVLDIGCGTGLLSLKFLQKADCTITGIDCSREMLAVFQEKIKRLKLADKVSLRSMDAGSLKFKDHTFDKVISTVTLHHLTDKAAVLKKIHKILKPGGVFVIGEIDMDTTGVHTDPKRLKRILRVLEAEWLAALKDAGVGAFSKMFDNGKKHILNQGEYCVSLKQWAGICRKAGFKTIKVKHVPRHKCFGVIVAKKP